MAQTRGLHRLARSAIVVQSVGGGLSCRPQGVLAAAFKELRPPEEVQIVRIIGPWIKAHGTALPNVIAVRLYRAFVGQDGIVILADTHENVRWHVNEMSGGGSVIQQSVG